MVYFQDIIFWLSFSKNKDKSFTFFPVSCFQWYLKTRHSLRAVCLCHIHFLFSMKTLCSFMHQYTHLLPSFQDLETKIFTRWAPNTTAADLLADGIMKDTSFFHCVCLDVGRGHHTVQGTSWTVWKRDLWLRITQQKTGNTLLPPYFVCVFSISIFYIYFQHNHSCLKKLMLSWHFKIDPLLKKVRFCKYYRTTSVIHYC